MLQNRHSQAYMRRCEPTWEVDSPYFQVTDKSFADFGIFTTVSVEIEGKEFVFIGALGKWTFVLAK